MPKNLQVRGVPDAVHAALRSRAAAAGMSLSDYVLRTLTEVAERPAVAELLRSESERSGGADRKAIVEVVRELRGDLP
jgi:plasmid stability protein